MENKYSLLLPHKPPIRMIDGLYEVEDNNFVSHVTVPQDSLYVKSGTLYLEVLLEVMAQCFAAGMGYKASQTMPVAGSAFGYLASIRNFEVKKNVRSGEFLIARCKILMRVDPIWVAEGTVLCRDEEIAHAQFKIYIPED